jgi:DNA-binding transcriptional regulator YiaG
MISGQADGVSLAVAETMAEALALAGAGKVTEARVLMTRLLAEHPELQGLPKLGQKLREFGLAPETGDYADMPEETRKFLTGLGDSPDSASYLKGIRAALGLSQHAMASRLNVPRTTLASWETGACAVPGSIMGDLISLYGERIQEVSPKPYTAEEIRAIRRRLELSAAKFGALLGTSQAIVWRWENVAGASPSRQYAAKITALLREKGIERESLFDHVSA